MRFEDGRLEARFSRWQAPALGRADRVHGALLAAGHSVALLARLLLPTAAACPHGAAAHVAGAPPCAPSASFHPSQVSMGEVVEAKQESYTVSIPSQGWCMLLCHDSGLPLAPSFFAAA